MDTLSMQNYESEVDRLLVLREPAETSLQHLELSQTRVRRTMVRPNLQPSSQHSFQNSSDVGYLLRFFPPKP